VEAISGEKSGPPPFFNKNAELKLYRMQKPRLTAISGSLSPTALRLIPEWIFLRKSNSSDSTIFKFSKKFWMPLTKIAVDSTFRFTYETLLLVLLSL
jgi:hypothetical protein